MKMTKLLTGAAIAALMAGAAQAQVVTELRLDANVSADVGVAGGPNEIIASEYDITEAANQFVEFTIVPRNATNTADLDAGFAAYAGTSVDVVISVSNAIFPTAIVAADGPATGTAGVCAPTLVSGGLAGESSVTFRIADLSLCDDDGTTGGFGDADADEAALGFSLPIDLTGANANVSYTMTTTGTGAPVSSATFARAAGVDAALTTTVVEDIDSLFVSVPGYSVVATGADRTALLSTTGVSYNTLDAGGLLGTITFADAAQALIGPGGAPADWDTIAQVDEVEIIVTVADPTGFTSVTLDGPTTNDTTVALTNGVATFTITDTASTGLDTQELDDGAVNVILNEDADDTTLINETTHTIAVSTVDGATGSNVTIGGSSDTENIFRQGDSDTFQWIGDANASTASIMRVTGIDTTDVPAISFTLANSTNGTAFDGEYALGTYTPSAGGELIITNTMLGDIAGEFGRADVTIFIEGDVADIDLFHATAGVITLGQDGGNAGE